MKNSNRNLPAPVAAALVLFVCLAVGTILSLKKPLWNDELHTQANVIDRSSYTSILQGNLVEGNVYPLFYLIQKTLCGALHYQFPRPWNGEWEVAEPRSQIIMRIGSNVFMSSALALIFYFFLRNFSLGAGCYALGVALSSSMIWSYWAEARPYALWIWLTTAQALLFFELSAPGAPDGRAWRRLTLVHILLSLTVMLGMAQIAAVSFLLWLIKERNWRKYLFPTVIPLAVGIFYYLHSPQFKFWFLDTPIRLFLANVPPDRLAILAGYAVFLLLRKRTSVSDGKSSEKFFLLTVSMLVLAWGILGVFIANAGPPPDGFSIANRYFIFLVPVEIIATTLCSLHVWRYARGNKWLRLNLIIALGGLLIFRMLKTYLRIAELGMY